MREIRISIFAEYNQKDASVHNLFISVRRSTCFRRVFRPSSGAQNCTYSVKYRSDKYLTLYVQFWAPDDRRKTRLKHVERLTEINKLWTDASCWLYSATILAMQGPMNVKFIECQQNKHMYWFHSIVPALMFRCATEIYRYLQYKHIKSTEASNISNKKGKKSNIV